MLASRLPRPPEQDANYLFKKESADRPLTQLPASRRLAHPFHPPHPPLPALPAAPAPASTQLASSSRDCGEQVGSPGRAAEAMEASAGDDRDPGGLRAHRPAAPAAAPSAKFGMGGGAARGSGRGAGRAACCPPGFLAAVAQLSAAVGSAAWVSPPAFTRTCLFSPPPQVADQGQAAAAATADALRQARPKWGEPAGLRRASGLR